MFFHLKKPAGGDGVGGAGGGVELVPITAPQSFNDAPVVCSFIYEG